MVGSPSLYDELRVCCRCIDIRVSSCIDLFDDPLPFCDSHLGALQLMSIVTAIATQASDTYGDSRSPEETNKVRF